MSGLAFAVLALGKSKCNFSAEQLGAAKVSFPTPPLLGSLQVAKACACVLYAHVYAMHMLSLIRSHLSIRGWITLRLPVLLCITL